MPRGGKRIGAGGQFKYKHGKTTVIRVPVVLVEQILKYAKELDEELFELNAKSASEDLRISSLADSAFDAAIGYYKDSDPDIFETIAIHADLAKKLFSDNIESADRTKLQVLPQEEILQQFTVMAKLCLIDVASEAIRVEAKKRS